MRFGIRSDSSSRATRRLLQPLSLLGALVQFGWEKALGGYDEELVWWEAKAIQAAPLLVS